MCNSGILVVPFSELLKNALSATNVAIGTHRSQFSEVEMFGEAKSDPNIWKGLATGLVAGLAATAVMTQFQNTWQKVITDFEGSKDGEGEAGQQKNEGSDQQAQAQSGDQAEKQGEEEPSGNPTEAVAEGV